MIQKDVLGCLIFTSDDLAPTHVWAGKKQLRLRSALFNEPKQLLTKCQGQGGCLGHIICYLLC